MAAKKAAKTVATGAAVPENKGTAVVVTVQELGKIVTRTFNSEDHGSDWRKQAEQFIETCKLEDGEKRPKYVSHAEVK